MYSLDFLETITAIKLHEFGMVVDNSFRIFLAKIRDANRV